MKRTVFTAALFATTAMAGAVAAQHLEVHRLAVGRERRRAAVRARREAAAAGREERCWCGDGDGSRGEPVLHAAAGRRRGGHQLDVSTLQSA